MATTARALVSRNALYRFSQQLKHGPAQLFAVQNAQLHLKVNPLVDYSNQSVEHPDGSRSLRLKDGTVPERMSYQDKDAKTVYEIFLRGMKIAGENGDFIGYREQQSDGSYGDYKYITYKESHQTSIDIGAALRELDVPPGQEEKIGVFMKNRVEWMLVDHMCCAYNNVAVPIYSTFAAWAIEHIIKQCDMHVVFAENAANAELLLECKKNAPSLRVVVVIEGLTEDLVNLGIEREVKLIDFKKLMAKGEKVRGKHSLQLPKPDDLYTICYTSGTTGSPKGVLIKHSNVTSAATNMRLFGEVMDIYKNDPEFTFFSYLPFAHVFDRVLEMTLVHEGTRIAYTTGDMANIVSDMKAANPHFIIAVPRILDKVHAKVMSELSSSPLKNWLFHKGIDYKEGLLEKGIITNETLVDKVLFTKIRDIFGGRLHQMMIGSAPVTSQVYKFIRSSLGCVVLEGYGMTETCVSFTVNPVGYSKIGSVGAPMNNVVIKLIDAPECGYKVGENGGEICVKGPSITSGYYKDPERTSKLFDKDGWMLTGDIGKWTEDGALEIVDRKKNIFKLAQGEYVAPEKIENIYSGSRIVEQCCVHGQPDKLHLLVFIVPVPEVFVNWCKAKLDISGSIKELCANETVRKAVLEKLRKRGRKEGLHGFEQAKDVFISPEPFTIDNGLLTPTMKVKRRELVNMYQDEINAMYKQLDAQYPSKKI